MVKLSNRRLLAVALVLSLITSGLIYNYLKKAAVSKTENYVPVVVAKADIPPKTKITAAMVELKQMPAPYVQPHAIDDLSTAIGTMSMEYIAISEQLTKRQLLLGDKPDGFAGQIPPDRRAITIAVNEVSGVAGLVKVGDYVDVVTTFDDSTVGNDVSRIMLQNVLVLAVNRTTATEQSAPAKEEKSSAKAATTITLAVSPAEATQLALAAEKGKVHLALRPYMATIDYAIALPVTPQDIVGSHTMNNKATPPASTPQPVQPSSGIQMIRGTTVETIPVN